MVFLGMWACRYRELQPITFGIGGSSSSSSQQQASDLSGQGGGDCASGSGGRKGRGNDFEMGIMKSVGEQAV